MTKQSQSREKQDAQAKRPKPVRAEARRKAEHTTARRRGVVNLHAAGQEIRLSAKLEPGDFRVDREGNGALRNVSILTAGVAIGHDFVVDDVMLQQVADAINASRNGVKSRISHPWLDDGIFFRLGRATRGARVEGGKVRGDIVLGAYAASSPKGDLADYVLGLAEEDAADVGVSISFLAAEYEGRTDENGLPVLPAGRLKKLLAVDIVDDPAANPDGLLGARPAQEQPGRGDGTPGTNTYGDAIMKLNARQRAYLASCGLAKDATDEQANELAAKLKPEQRTYLESLSGDETPPATAPAPPAGQKATELSAGQAPRAAEPPDAAERALAADRERRKAILAMAGGDKPAVDLDTARRWADDGVSTADAQRLAEMARTMKAVPTARVEGGEDRNLATIADGISDALLLRAGAPLMTFDRRTGQAQRDEQGRIVARKPGARAEALCRMPLPELARQYLAAVGVDAPRLGAMSAEEAIDLSSCRRDQFSRRLREAGGSVDLAMSTSDFPYILADAMNKVFLGGYNLAPSTWPNWCRRQTARDFKDVKLLNLSEAPALAARAEGQGINFGTMSESREVVALAEYTSGVIWTRRAQLNDDLGVLRDGGAQALGAMARYKEDDVVYAILTANARLSDNVALFDATHGNLSAGAATAVYAAAAPGVCPTVVALFLESEPSPVLKQEVQWDTDDLKVAVRHSVAAKAADYRGLYKDVTGTATVESLAAILEAMALQTGPGGAFLNLRPAFLLCPSGVKEVAFAQLVGSSVDPSKANATPNPFFNRLTVIGEPRLNA